MLLLRIVTWRCPHASRQLVAGRYILIPSLARSREAVLQLHEADDPRDGVWPHTAGFNKLNVEATIPDSVYNELRARGHDVSRLRAFGMSGCATGVMIAKGARLEG